ncbi:hypothetical protein Vafri_4297 [Volvox africanus]|uniref:Uncharacterized protein n=1 Tax=Volvox africanus TaxID=51714 RepID=A0A8J4EVN9_9CHLO|nr:hypothetical protein Vafri_4297 [Volvox africanus]
MAWRLCALDGAMRALVPLVRPASCANWMSFITSGDCMTGTWDLTAGKPLGCAVDEPVGPLGLAWHYRNDGMPVCRHVGLARSGLTYGTCGGNVGVVMRAARTDFWLAVATAWCHISDASGWHSQPAVSVVLRDATEFILCQSTCSFTTGVQPQVR